MTVISQEIKWFISLIAWSALRVHSSIISGIVVEHYQQSLTSGDSLDGCHHLIFCFYTGQTSFLD